MHKSPMHQQQLATAQRLYAQQDIPSPKRRLRKLQWTKLKSDKVSTRPNVWTSMGGLGGKYPISFDRMEELFSLDDGSAAAAGGQLLDITSSSTSSPSADKRRKEEVSHGENREMRVHCNNASCLRFTTILSGVLLGYRM